MNFLRLELLADKTQCNFFLLLACSCGARTSCATSCACITFGLYCTWKQYLIKILVERAVILVHHISFLSERHLLWRSIEIHVLVSRHNNLCKQSVSRFRSVCNFFYFWKKRNRTKTIDQPHIEPVSWQNKFKSDLFSALSTYINEAVERD